MHAFLLLQPIISEPRSLLLMVNHVLFPKQVGLGTLILALTEVNIAVASPVLVAGATLGQILGPEARTQVWEVMRAAMEVVKTLAECIWALVMLVLSASTVGGVVKTMLAKQCEIVRPMEKAVQWADDIVQVNQNPRNRRIIVTLAPNLAVGDVYCGKRDRQCRKHNDLDSSLSSRLMRSVDKGNGVLGALTCNFFLEGTLSEMESCWETERCIDCVRLLGTRGAGEQYE
jgi:hypothetical protein